MSSKPASVAQRNKQTMRPTGSRRIEGTIARCRRWRRCTGRQGHRRRCGGTGGRHWLVELVRSRMVRSKARHRVRHGRGSCSISTAGTASAIGHDGAGCKLADAAHRLPLDGSEVRWGADGHVDLACSPRPRASDRHFKFAVALCHATIPFPPSRYEK